MYTLPKGLIFRAIENERSPLDDVEFEIERSRYVCYRCTREVHALVLCPGPICRRCTGVAQMQKVLAPTEAIPEPVSALAKKATEILGRHHGQRHFQLPKVKPKPKPDEDLH